MDCMAVGFVEVFPCGEAIMVGRMVGAGPAAWRHGAADACVL